MLGKIKYQNKEVTLINKNLELNDLYSVDSLSLIIGKNGAGKTHFLREIAKRYVTQKNKFSNNLCEFYDPDGIEMSEEDIDGSAVIYFTSLPYRTIFGFDDECFVDASPSLSSLNEAHNLGEFAQYLLDFGIEPQAEIRRYTNFSRSLKVILELIDAEVVYFPDFTDTNFVMHELRYLKINMNKMKASRKENPRISSPGEILMTQKALKNATENAIGVLYSDIERSFSQDIIFAVMTVIESRLDRNKLIRNQVTSVLHYYFDAKINIKDTESFNNRLTVDVRHVRSLLQFLKEKEINSHVYVFKSRLSEIFGSFNLAINPFSEEPFSTSKKIISFLKVEFTKVSSGELALINQMKRISEAIDILNKKNVKDILLLIDEGDAFLHLSWQQKYISLLNKMLGKLKEKFSLNSLQVILATHSPLLATDVPNDFICRLDEDNTENVSGFAAPLHTLFRDSFDTNSIGTFAAETITGLIERAKMNKLKNSDYHLTKRIENSVIKDEIQRLIKKNN